MTHEHCAVDWDVVLFGLKPVQISLYSLFLWEFDTQVTGTRSLMSLFPLVLWYFSTHDYCTVQDRISMALARDIRCALAMACVWWFGQEMLG